jgi:hypothetical protein
MQLLIIDVQNTYRKYCHNLIGKIPQLASNYGEVVYLFDNINGQEFYEEVPEEWMEEETFYDRLKIISKNYAFFRGLIDAGVDEDDSELVRLAQFMRKNQIIDARDIKEDEEVLEKYQIEFKHSPLQNIDFEDYSFYLPEDLIEQLESNIKNGVVLVGGGRNECLKEVALLLKVLDIKFSILEEYTY